MACTWMRLSCFLSWQRGASQVHRRKIPDNASVSACDDLCVQCCFEFVWHVGDPCMRHKDAYVDASFTLFCRARASRHTLRSDQPRSLHVLCI